MSKKLGNFLWATAVQAQKKEKKKMMSITWVGKWEKMLSSNYCLFPKGNSTARFAFPLLTLENSYLHQAVGKNFGWDLWLRLCSTKNTSRTHHRKPYHPQMVQKLNTKTIKEPWVCPAPCSAFDGSVTKIAKWPEKWFSWESSLSSKFLRKR